MTDYQVFTDAARRPQVSVIVVNWNRRGCLAACLCSLQRQSFQDFEVIVVDNGSTDGSVELVRERFPEVRLLALKENTGFCRANNLGIQEAKGEYIALLNNDAEAHPRWLEELIKAFEGHPEVGFCASKMVLYDRRERLDSAGDGFSLAGAGFKIGHRDRADKPQYNKPRYVFGACAGAAIYRREMLEDVGLFDEDFFLTQEDIDLSFRAQLRGWKCLYVPRAVVYHRLNTTLKRMSQEYVYYGHRNLEWVYAKNVPGPLLAVTLPLHLLDDLLALGYFALKGRGGAFIRAKADALRGLPRMLKKRREIQRGRRVPLRYLLAIWDRSWPWGKIGRLLRDSRGVRRS